MGFENDQERQVAVAQVTSVIERINQLRNDLLNPEYDYSWRKDFQYSHHHTKSKPFFEYLQTGLAEESPSYEKIYDKLSEVFSSEKAHQNLKDLTKVLEPGNIIIGKDLSNIMRSVASNMEEIEDSLRQLSEEIPILNLQVWRSIMVDYMLNVSSSLYNMSGWVSNAASIDLDSSNEQVQHIRTVLLKVKEFYDIYSFRK